MALEIVWRDPGVAGDAGEHAGANLFAVLESLRDHAQGESLDPGDRLLTGLPIGKRAPELRDLRDPAPIFLAVNLDG